MIGISKYPGLSSVVLSTLNAQTTMVSIQKQYVDADK